MPASWSIAVLTSREDEALLLTNVEAALAAAANQHCIVDIVVNGNATLARHVAERVRSMRLTNPPIPIVRVWSIALGDKAHAFNSYIHLIWPGSETAFFLDGYAEPMRDSLSALANGLAEVPGALAASAVPTYGRSAHESRQELAKNGGLYGCLFALRGTTVRAFREKGVRLPLGIYRTDGTTGAMLCFGLDPANNKWDPKRIVVRADASWKYQPARLESFIDIRTQFRRMTNQAWGKFVNEAVKDHLALKRRPLEELPADGLELVRAWAFAHPLRAFLLLLRWPLAALCMWRIRSRDWSAKEVPPVLVYEST